MKILFSYPHSTVLFELVLTSNVVIEYFSRFYIDNPNKTADRVVTIKQNSLEKTVVCGMESVNYDNDTIAIVRICEYIRVNMLFEEGWTALHGSAISILDKNYLFLGHTGAGKTTLSAYLSIQNGVDIISEDIVIINIHTLECIHRKSPMSLRAGGYDILKNEYSCQLHIDGVLPNGKLIYVPPSYEAKEKYYISSCFLLVRKDNINVSAELIEGELNYILNSFCFNNMKYNIKCAIALSKKLPMYRFNYSNLDQALEFLSNN